MSMANKTKVIISVDTEASVAGAFDDPQKNEPKLHEVISGSINGVSEGLGFILRTLEKHNLKATFFYETMQTRCFGYDASRNYIQQLKSANQDIQLHVHPCWQNYEKGALIKTEVCDHMTKRPVDEITSIYQESIEHFVNLVGEKPVAVRNGSFSAGMDTYEALQNVGIPLTSNVSFGAMPSKEQELQIKNGIHRFGKVTEIPVTCFDSYNIQGKKRQRMMAITACSLHELTSVLNLSHKNGLGVVSLLTHTFEFFNRRSYRFDGLTRHLVNQRRFSALCHFLDKNKDKFEVVTFGQLSQKQLTPQKQILSPINPGYLSAFGRTVENVANDKLLSKVQQLF